MEGKGSNSNKRFKKRKYNKKTRERIRRRKELLQAEFDKEGLNLIATYRDVTSCPPVKEQFRKKIGKPKVISSAVLREPYIIKDLGDKILVKPRICFQPEQSVEPPLICLITPPRSDENPDVEILPQPVQPSVIKTRDPKLGSKVAFKPGRRINSSSIGKSRPILFCGDCKVRPRPDFCKKCFECNYHYNHAQNILRDKLRELFGESDISD